LPAIFSDHAVLQKSGATAVWGWSDPGEKVMVAFGSESVDTTADAQGHWKATLDLTAASTDPQTLQVAGKNKLTVTDVVAGDVWLSSGQSNMQFTLNATTGGWDEIARSADPSLRWFMAKYQSTFLGPQDDVPGQWFVAGPGTSGDCSGVAYYFAKKLRADLHRPMGLVLTAVGGTTIQSWMSSDSLNAPDVKNALDLAFPPKPNRKPQLTPSFFYNQLIAPLGNLSLHGVIWYQGEAHFNQGDYYRVAFPALIRDWRSLWHQSQLPFYYCQLPNMDKKTADANDVGWIAGLRKAQDAGLKEPQTGEAILIDVGGVEFHPPGKQVVGERLAQLAEAGTHGLPVAAQSPRYDSVTLNHDQVDVRFTNCPGGLVAADLPKDEALASPGSAVEGFALCGADGKWAWAQATIKGDTVEVSSPAVPQPIAVRYAWSNNPTCNLQNRNGLPAAPFQATIPAK
jgi:sialate O-acetylesterase